MLWNWYHTKVGGLLWRSLLWQLEIGWDHISEFFCWLFQGLLHDDLVHGPSKVLVDLIHDAGGVDILSGLEVP